MVFKIGRREQFTDMYFPRKDVGDFVHLTKDLVQDGGQGMLLECLLIYLTKDF